MSKSNILVTVPTFYRTLYSIMDDDGEYEIEDAPPLTIDVKPEVVIIPSDDDDDVEHVDDDRSSTPSSRRSRKKRRIAAHDEVMLSSDDELEETATVARRRPVMDCGESPWETGRISLF